MSNSSLASSVVQGQVHKQRFSVVKPRCGDMTHQSLPILVKLYPRQQILDDMELGRIPGLFSKLSGDQLHPELVAQDWR